ncbi:MAG: response regulator transcription factor [Woeseiaceae bacterium]|nr:response regulator transcription factor [Woeseiaceae bacterium]
MKKILIIEDSKDLAFGLRSNLEMECYEVRVAETGPEGLHQATVFVPDLVVLDLMLPQMNGFKVLESMRARRLDMPVLILSARSEEIDKVRGLRSGADDYVTKPFGLMELLARVEAMLRRGETSGRGKPEADDGNLRLRDIEICTRTRTVSRHGGAVDLTPKEFDLLLELLRHEGAVVSRIDLMKTVWGHSSTIVSRTVDTHIAELRRKLEDDASNPTLILTVRKVGYRLVQEEP